MAGRPTKLTPEIAQRIEQAVAAGNYLETAAAFAGISKQTLYKWLRKGARAKSGEHRAFVDAVEKALAQAEVRDVANIARAASGYDVVRTKERITTDGKVERMTETGREFSWQASAWRLERKYPDRWGRRVDVAVTGELSGEVSGEIGVKHEGLVLTIGGPSANYIAQLQRARGVAVAALPAVAGATEPEPETPST